ncbi:vicilin-like seed storage protein At2g18540 [Homalodisca vitripennis]|uniref:vicilin-like seed storage protein At2g18540 n=1 Tax=Homalodisca vitripennis TaxID=197043 RepID=UPI001EECE138|nr:vicilin-like seed storage protein At2g18540 [Homalodisca vitripennis]
MAGTNGKEKLPQEGRSLGTESLPSATAGGRSMDSGGSKPARSDVEGGDRRKQEIEKRRKEEEKRRAEMEGKRKEEMEKEKYERELLEQQKRRKSLARSPILPAQIERSQVDERMEGVEQSTIASEEGEGNEGEDEGESEIEKVRRSPSDVEKREIERRARERRRLKEVEEGLTQNRVGNG